MSNKKGFTITELLAVIAIVAVLSIAAISGYTTMANNSKKKTLEQKVSQIELAAEKYAKDNNLKNTSTISINKLVVMGYLQPDSTNSDGMALLNNPVNNENLVCNLVTIRVENDGYKAEFVEKGKDCNIARSEIIDSNVIIKVVKYKNDGGERTISTIGSAASKEYNWANDDLLININSTTYESQSRSITYEYGGNSITKEIVDGNKAANPSDSTNYKETNYNELVIKDYGLIFYGNVNIIYNLKSGGTKKVDIIIKIDKERPTGYTVVNNDTSADSRKTVKIYLDDANGSGVKGFYASSRETFDSSALYVGNKKTSNSEGGMDLKYNEKGSTMKVPRGDYYVYPVDMVDNIGGPLKVVVDNFDPNDLSCTITVKNSTGTDITVQNKTWYNQSLVLRAESNNILGTYGAKYNFLKNKTSLQEKDLTLQAPPNEKLAVDKVEPNEMNETDYAAGLIGLSSVNNSLRYCHVKVGIDMTKPTASVTATGTTTYKKQHKLTVTITDNRSGFNANANGKLAFKYGWSTSKDVAPTTWKDAEATLSNGNKKATKELTEGSGMTGEYYVWILGSSVKDKAENVLDNTVGTMVFKFDNTEPRCTNSGDNSTWRQEPVTIVYSCADDHSGCTSTGVGQKVYSSTKKTDTIQAYNIEDKAGNKRSCPARTADIYVDKTKPSCTNSGDKTNWSSGDITLYYGCSDGESGCNPSKSGGSVVISSSSDKVTVPAYDIEDNVGNKTTCPARTASVYIDNTKPTCTNSGDSTKWTASDRTINYGCSDTGSGCDPSNSGSSKKFTTTTKQANIAAYTIKDKVGNTTNCPARTADVYVDKTKPTCTNSGDSTSWTASDRTISYGCSDTDSGCDPSNSGSSKKFTTTTKQANIAAYTIKDKVGNQESCPARTANVYVDKTKPTCTNSGDSTSWTASDRTISYGCKDDQSGCDPSNSGGSKPFTTTTKQSDIASYTIKDKVGNQESCVKRTADVYVDKTKPTVSSVSAASRNKNYNTKSVDINVKGSDSHSNVAKACVQTSNDVNSCTWRNFDGDDTYTKINIASAYDGATITIYAWVKDAVGNVSDVKTSTYKVYKNCTATTNDGDATCGTYGTCSKTCGSGIQYATKTQKKKDSYTGVACTSVVTANGCDQACNTQDCCSKVTYVNGTTCTAVCGGGTYNRIAYSAYNNQRCGANDKSSGGGACNTQDCCSSINTQCGPWTWTGCTATCDGGTMYQYRICNSYSNYNGALCNGSFTQTQNVGTACNTQACAVARTYSGTYSGSSSATTVSFAVSNYLAAYGVAATSLTSGTLGQCTYDGATLSCPISGIAGSTASSDESCAIANGKDIANAFYYKGSCYVHAGHSPGFNGNGFTCGSRTSPHIPGSSNHCPKQASNGHVHCTTGNNCVQAEKHKIDNPNYDYVCWCWSKGDYVNHTIYTTTYTLQYYVSG